MSMLAGVAVALLLSLVIAHPIYNVYWHQLSNVPGPALWAATRIPYIYYMLSGQLVHEITRLHTKYGHAVRIAPNEVSFTDPEAWKDIYGYRRDIVQFPKNPVWHKRSGGRSSSISNADNSEHARLRRLLTPAFSIQSVKSQEPILKRYTAMLIATLGEMAASHKPVNLVDWLMFTTFDIVGELTFHEPFNCLESQKLHPWIAATFGFFKATTVIACARFLPLAERLLLLFRTSHSVKLQQQHAKHTISSVNRRLEASDHTFDFEDFVGYLKRGFSDDSISVEELYATVNVLVVGGSETTASALSGTMNYLVRNSSIYRKLAKEVRDEFSNVDEMTVDSLEKLAYLDAVLREGLRLCPPVPCGLPRMAPPAGATVCGYRMPPGTNVSVHQFASLRSPTLWTAPDSFAPERWLDADNEKSPYAQDRKEAWRPFSTGPRRCVGERLAWAEMRLVLANIVFHFDIEPVQDGAKTPVAKWEKQETFALWTRQAFQVQLKSRF